MVFNASFKGSISKRLSIVATCKFLPDGIRSQIDVSRYNVEIKPSAGFWGKRLENADQIMQSLVPTSAGDSLDDLAGACAQLAVTGLQLRTPNNGSTLIKSMIDNKVTT
jgi:hypothetical protein